MCDVYPTLITVLKLFLTSCWQSRKCKFLDLTCWLFAMSGTNILCRPIYTSVHSCIWQYVQDFLHRRSHIHLWICLCRMCELWRQCLKQNIQKMKRKVSCISYLSPRMNTRFTVFAIFWRWAYKCIIAPSHCQLILKLLRFLSNSGLGWELFGFRLALEARQDPNQHLFDTQLHRSICMQFNRIIALTWMEMHVKTAAPPHNLITCAVESLDAEVKWPHHKQQSVMSGGCIRWMWSLMAPGRDLVSQEFSTDDCKQ